MNSTLPTPDRDLSRRILATVPYAGRFPAGRLRPPVGIIPGAIRSLHELHLVLTPDDRSLPGVNPERLIAWIDTTVGDPALAERLRREHASATSYVDWCLQTFELVGERLTQARQSAGEETPA